ncbi:unnamed protein product [Urochloa humidicola]
MADLAIGISRTAIQSLADKVKSAIKEEAEKWQIVERDLVFITGEFEMMQSFLDTVDEEHVKNKVVRTWVRQVRDLSYDVEDCIEFVLHLDTEKRTWWLRLLPSCGKAAKALPVDEAVTQIMQLKHSHQVPGTKGSRDGIEERGTPFLVDFYRAGTLAFPRSRSRNGVPGTRNAASSRVPGDYELKSRAVDVSQRNLRYNLISDSGSKPINQVQRIAASSTSSFDILINAVKKSGLLDLAGLVMRQDEDLQVISVCGPDSDLGKVAIMRKVYNDSRTYKGFECRAWVKLMDPLNPLEFIRSSMTQFTQDVIVGLDVLKRMQATATLEDLMEEFAEKVSTHRYLIVLEGLCTMAQWDAIRSYLPDSKKGSRIVVLTHQPVIASLCAGEPCRVSELGQLSPENSVRVYFREVKI